MTAFQKCPDCDELFPKSYASCPKCQPEQTLAKKYRRRRNRSLAAGLLGLLMVSALGVWFWRQYNPGVGEARSDSSGRPGHSSSESRGPVQTPGNQPSQGISTKRDAPISSEKEGIFSLWVSSGQLFS